MRKGNRFVRGVAILISWLILSTLSIVPVMADIGVESVATFDPLAGEQPEGIAVDKVGNIYFGFDPLGEVWKISPGGSPALFKAFGDPGALGMAVDAPGNVYVAGKRSTLIPMGYGESIGMQLPNGWQVRRTSSSRIPWLSTRQEIST